MSDVNEMIYELKNMIYNNTVNKDTIIEVFEYLQSLQVKVPKFIADWYEENSYHGVYDMIRYIKAVDDLEDERVYDWFTLISQDDYTDDMIAKTIVKMYLFGYEVQEWS